MGTHTSRTPADDKDEFQAIVQLMPKEAPDDDALEELATMCVAALMAGAPGLALGVVGSVNLDGRFVELEMTIEASSDSEVHQKMALIMSALERGTTLRLRESTASRVADRELVCA
jgi:hypothetical protein